jgi:hypothetical protein
LSVILGKLVHSSIVITPARRDVDIKLGNMNTAIEAYIQSLLGAGTVAAVVAYLGKQWLEKRIKDESERIKAHLNESLRRKGKIFDKQFEILTEVAGDVAAIRRGISMMSQMLAFANLGHMTSSWNEGTKDPDPLVFFDDPSNDVALKEVRSVFEERLSGMLRLVTSNVVIIPPQIFPLVREDSDFIKKAQVFSDWLERPEVKGTISEEGLHHMNSMIEIDRSAEAVVNAIHKYLHSA